MAVGHVRGAAPFARQLELCAAFPGGITGAGEPVGVPAELARARIVLGLCERFGCLPPQVLELDASVLRMIDVYERGKPPEPEGGEL